MFNLSLVQRPDGCYAMLSAQCGWLLSCFVITILQQRTQASATTSSTNTATSSMTNDHRQNRPQKEQQTLDNKTSETDADAEAGVTCYTCVNVSDNLVCNRFAIDRPCPQGEDFCHTLHIMDSRGESVVVNKKCADQRECSPQHVGCLSIDRQTVCVSCCDEMYCNISVPSNQSTAVFSDARTKARRREQQYHNNSSNSNIGSQLLPSCSNSSSHLLIVVLLMMLMTTMLLAT